MLLEFFLMYSTTVGRRREKQMKGEVFFRKLQLVSTLVFFYFFLCDMGSFFFFFFWIGMRGSVFFIKCEVSFGYLEEMTNEEWKVQTNLVCARGMGVFFF